MFAKTLSLLTLLLAILYVGALFALYVLPRFDYAFTEVGADNTALGIADGDSILIKKTGLAVIRAGNTVAFAYKNYAYPAFLEVKAINQNTGKLTLYMDKEKNATMDISYNSVQGVKILRLPHLAGTIAFLHDFTGKMLAAVITGGFVIVRFGLGIKRKGGLEL